MSGYAATPLIKKLGLRPSHKISVVNAPENYFQLLEATIELSSTGKKEKADFIHCFVRSEDELQDLLPGRKEKLEPDGMIWISWYKKASKIPTDVTEDCIRSLALAIGLVDVKVCAIDAQWSGLKLVIPVKNRKPDKG
jgi:hypothetical protein